MDNVSVIIKMEENNLSNLKKHELEKKTEIEKFQTVKKSYDKLFENEDLNEVIKRKYSLEYMFLFEQYTQKLLPHENFIKRSRLYSKRLEKILDFLEINNTPNPSFSALRSKLYQINGIVISEAVCYYDGLIEKYKQEKIMNSKFVEYISYLKKLGEDITKYESVLPTELKNQKLELSLDQAIKERNILIEIFRNEKFSFNDSDIMLLSKADIPDVLDIMYPSFKERLSEEVMKGKQAA